MTKIVEKIYQISAKYFTAGIVVTDDIVVKAAPILKWMVGKDIAHVKSYCKHKKYKLYF